MQRHHPLQTPLVESLTHREILKKKKKKRCIASTTLQSPAPSSSTTKAQPGSLFPGVKTGVRSFTFHSAAQAGITAAAAVSA